MPTAPTATAPTSVVRIEVHPTQAHHDARARRTLIEAKAHFGDQVAAVTTADIFLIEGRLTSEAADQIGAELLADPIDQIAATGAHPAQPNTATLEVHYLPGVMDPVADSTRD
ncbi:MAG: hypothetical protein V3V20_04760, partial [Algisphaera sp.]